MKFMGILGTVVLSAAALAACSDDDGNPSPGSPGGSSGRGGSAGSSGRGGSAGSSAGTGGSSGNGGSGGDAGPDSSAGTGGNGGTAGGDAGPDGGPQEFSGLVPMSDTEHDRAFAVAFDAQSRIYIAGMINAPRGTAADTKFAVARFLPSGTKDLSFGEQGVASHDVIRGTVADVPAANEAARGVVIQSDGKVVLVGNAEANAAGADANAQDADVVAVRFTSAGVLDTTFGDNGSGVKRVDLGSSTTSVRDQAWGVALAAQDKLVVFASHKAPDPRTDRDRVVFQLTANGELDTTFNNDSGRYVLDAEGLNANDEPRNGFVQVDGKIVFAGYAPMGATDAGTGAENQIVLLRLNADGTPDNTFGGDGVAVLTPLANPGMTEAYGAVRQTTGKYVTTGYGRSVAGPAPVDLVSVRANADGTPDGTWSDNDGFFLYDAAGFNDRGRNLLALPDDRIVMVGTAMPTANNEDALVVVLTADGVLDTTFHQDGIRTYDFGRTNDEEFFGVALSPDGKWVAAAGYAAHAAGDAGAVDDEDSSLAIFRVAP